MTNALVKSGGSGVVPAICSAVVPGVGQLVNRQTDKAIGVFAVWTVAGLSLLGAIPIVGGLAGLIGTATWAYAVGDAYVTGKRR